MPTKCFALIRGRAMRVTRTNACGAVVLGPQSVVTSEGFIQIALTANTEEGETISQTNAAGNVCIFDQPAPKFTGYTVEVQFCGVDPDLYSLMTGQPVVLNGDDEAVGFQVNSDVNLDGQGFALESWSTVPAAACEAGEASYGYFLSPFLKGGVIGDFTIANDAVNFTLSGAQTKDGNSWGVGPHDVLLDTGSPSPLLLALPTTNHLHMQVVDLAPPETGCGATALGTADLTATAGTPSTPDSGSYYPTGMASVVATPGTAWTTGQYAEDWTGAAFHWDGAAWASGIAT